MKKYLFLLFITLNLTSIFAQNTPLIIPKWRIIMEDTTLKQTKKNRGIPVQYKQDKDDNLYIHQQTNFGFQLAKVNSKTGETFWTNGRNQDFPAIENKVYFPKDFFFRPDGNIEIMAGKGLKFPGLTTFSTAIKLVYDVKTGKELFSYFEPKKGGSAVLLNTGALVGQVIKNTTFYYLADGLGNVRTAWIRTLDTNFVANDTIYLKKVPQDTANNKLATYGASPLHQINGKLYYMISLFGGALDTANSKFYLYKIDPKTKKVITNDMSKKLFYGLNNCTFETCKDGFLVTSLADSLFSYSGIDNYNVRTMVTKIDTSGNIVWRTFLDPPNNLKSPIASITEDNKTNGYWVTVGARGGKLPNYLYYFNANGKSKFIGEMELPSKTRHYYPYRIKILNNSDLLVSYIYGDTLPNTMEYAGTVCFDRMQLDKLLVSEKNVVATNIDVLCYPNPSTAFVNIKSNEENLKMITCFDVTGKVVTTMKCNDTNITFPTYYLENGIYFLKIESEKGYVYKKIEVLHQ